MAEPDHASRAFALYKEIAEGPHRMPEVLPRLEHEHSEVLVLLTARLSAANALRGLAPSVQAIIDRRLHYEQLDANQALRGAMEKVSSTLLLVEQNQHALERANLKLGRAAVWLGIAQVIVAVITASSCNE